MRVLVIAHNVISETNNMRKTLLSYFKDSTPEEVTEFYIKVVFEIPDAVEASGYSKATKALLYGKKLKKLGWSPRYGIKEGIGRTLDILGA